MNGGRSGRAFAYTRQSMEATAVDARSCRTTRSSASIPCCGLNHSLPDAASESAIRPRSCAASAASPNASHVPHCTTWPGRPSARRRPASWSRNAFDAA